MRVAWRRSGDRRGRAMDRPRLDRPRRRDAERAGDRRRGRRRGRRARRGAAAQPARRRRATSRTRARGGRRSPRASREALRGVAPERVRGVATCATSGTIAARRPRRRAADAGRSCTTTRARGEQARAALDLPAVAGRCRSCAGCSTRGRSRARGRGSPTRPTSSRAALVGARRAVGLQPRAEDRLRPRARALAAGARACPATCCPTSCAAASRLGEVCARGRRRRPASPPARRSSPA